MRTTLKIIVTVLATTMLPILYLNIETVAVKFGWDAVIADLLIGRADAALAFALHPGTVLFAMLVLGIAVGVWLDALAKKFAANKPDVTPKISEIYYTLENIKQKMRNVFQGWEERGIPEKSRTIPIDLNAEVRSLAIKAGKIGLTFPNLNGLPTTKYLNALAIFIAEITPLAREGQLKEAREVSRRIADQVKSD